MIENPRGRSPAPAARRRTSSTAALAGLAVLVGAATAGACASDADPADEAVELDPASATVEYHYQDSSVPPEYHRSYTLTVTQGEADLVVDSYGDVLHDETAPIDEAAWEDLLAAVSEDGLSGGGAADGCSGGTGRDLRATDVDHPASDPAVAVSIEVCGGDGEDAAARVDAVVEPILARFDMAALLASG